MSLIRWKDLISKTNELIKDKKCLLAISGGVDSMVLLSFFYRTYKDTFVVAHFNHNIRDDSNLDEELVERYCTERGIPFFTSSGDIDISSNVEENCRNARWSFLEEVARENDCSAIVTGHHLNDKIENFIFRMMRGSDLSSLVMNKIGKVGEFYRVKPFLDIDKESIRTFADKTKIEYREDYTNKENNYDRNKIRNQLIPMMKEFFNIDKTLPSLMSRLDELLGENNDKNIHT